MYVSIHEGLGGRVREEHGNEYVIVALRFKWVEDQVGKRVSRHRDDHIIDEAVLCCQTTLSTTGDQDVSCG